MREGRQNYNISSLNLDQLNFTLALISDRLDELEGRRGTPLFKNVPDMDGNRISNVGTPQETKDALTKDISSDSVIEGTVNLFFTDARVLTAHNTIAGGHSQLTQATNFTDATASTVSVTGADAGGVYGVGEQALINELKADVNTLVTDTNNAIAKLNTLLANMRTAKQLA